MYGFEKGKIVAYNDCELSLCNIAKNRYHLQMDVFLKKDKKTGNYYKKDYGYKRKTSESEGRKIVRAAKQQSTAASQQCKDKLKLIFMSVVSLVQYYLDY